MLNSTNESVNNAIETLNEKVGKRLYGVRSLLMYSATKISKAIGIDGQTVGNFEEGKSGGQTDKLNALIFFYGYTHKEFYDFDKQLPTARQLKSRMKHFHESIGSDAYKIIYERPELIDVIQFRLLETDLFSGWATAEQVVTYCETTLKYKYLITSVHNTLNIAVKKGWLIVDEKARPKRYKKKG